MLLVPISLSGALLVWHDHLDALINPGRYAVTSGAAQQPSAILASATASLGRGLRRWSCACPKAPAGRQPSPRVSSVGGESGARPRVVTVYVDPPTARVLDTAEFRNSLIGFLHPFHENLIIPEYSGRAIVGWSGVGMLALSLSGIYLWWPRNAVSFAGCDGGADPRSHSTCIICLDSGLRSRLRWSRQPASISAFRSRLGSCCRRSRR